MAETNNSGLKKGMRIKIMDNPRNPESHVLGVATLVHCLSKQAYRDHPGETWVVQYDHTGEKRNHIVHPRDVVVETK